MLRVCHMWQLLGCRSCSMDARLVHALTGVPITNSWRVLPWCAGVCHRCLECGQETARLCRIALRSSRISILLHLNFKKAWLLKAICNSWTLATSSHRSTVDSNLALIFRCTRQRVVVRRLSARAFTSQSADSPCVHISVRNFASVFGYSLRLQQLTWIFVQLTRAARAWREFWMMIPLQSRLWTPLIW